MTGERYMGKQYDALCIGTALMDISTSGLDFDTFLVNEPNLAEAITYGAGGDAVNEATALAKLGYRSALITSVGVDFIGDFLRYLIAKNGVDVSGVHFVSRIPTAANNILIGKNDKRIYTLSKNATSFTEFCGADVDLERVREAKLVSFGSLFTHQKFQAEDYLQIFRAAKEAGAITCADTNVPWDDRSINELKPALAYLDYFFPSDMEGEKLTGMREPEDMADVFLALGIGTVIITCGSRGSYIKSREYAFWQPAMLVDAVGTTGAGDCYAAGFMSGLIDGLTPVQCARRAAATSACAVQAVGATSGLKSIEQIETFAAQYEDKNSSDD